ncbi:MAG TPA: POTRA domain-containing protein [Candidatus Acidoferrales bacterium]
MRVKLFRRRGVRLTLALLFSVLFSSFARAQAPAEAGSGKLAAVKVTGSSKFRSDQIAPATGLKPGATITKDDLQRGADRLAQLGPFSGVHYRYGDSDAGVVVEYQVTDAPAVPVWFDNFPWFTDAELISAVKSSVPLFDGTAPEHGTLLDDIADALQLALASRNVHTSVMHSLVTAPGGSEQIQQFRVDGMDLSVGSIDLSDPLARNDRGIQARLSDIADHPYSRTAIELFEFEQIRPVYLAQGFLRVKFNPPTTHLVGSGTTARVAVTITIDPGPAFAWNGITWSGNTVILSAELTALVTIKSGDPADEMKIEPIWEAVHDDYARRGYLDATVTPRVQFDDTAKRVSYTATISEGPQFRMGKLVLTGLSIEGDRRIRAAWKIDSGAIFDKDVYDEFISSGIKEAFTGLPFHYEKVGRFLQEDPKAGTVDVLLDFQ